MPSVSGLNREQRGRARDRVVQAALLALDNKDAMDYTDPTVQARIALRWDGIQNRRNSWRQEFPIHSDCSSFATWCLWNASSIREAMPAVEMSFSMTRVAASVLLIAPSSLLVRMET